MTTLKKFDILCLQETHCGPKDVRLLSISGYKMKHFNRPISGNHRYFGGMLLLNKDCLTKGISIVDNKHHDKLWIKLDKHFFSLKQDIFLGFTYVSPSTSSHFKTLSYDIFSEVEKDCQKFKSFGDIIITGDFNARTKTDDDYIIDEEDRLSPINDLDHYVVDSVPIARSNTDLNPVDSHGERLLELCKSNLLRILNGRFGNNSNRYTRYPTKLGDKPSVIDYTLTSKNLLSTIKSFNIEPFTILSDHCCLHTRIMCSNKYSAEVEHEQIKLNKVPNTFIMDKTSLGIFQTALVFI